MNFKQFLMCFDDMLTIFSNNKFVFLSANTFSLALITLREESVCGRNFCGSALSQNVFILREKNFGGSTKLEVFAGKNFRG